MGGTVAVTVRKESGEEFRMSRWTNSMPWGICNNRMFEKNESHVDDYLSQWLEMRDDYEANKDTGKFIHNMTDCYFPGDLLAPDGYGLVVVDLMNDVILDMQGYTSFDYISVAGVSLSLSGNIIGETEDDSDVTRLKELWEAGRVKGWTTKKSFKSGKEYEKIPYTFDEVVKFLSKGDVRNVYQFIIDTSPFKYEKFEEYTVEGITNFRKRILELGFKLSDEEEQAWANALKEAQKYED